MSRLLEWRGAVHEDRAALMSFTCTDPPRRRRVPPYGYEHDREWELVIQRYIRNMQPPYRQPMKVWVGYDEEGLGAVAAVEELHSAADVSITLMAVAQRHRGEGGGYADDMMDFVLADIEGVGVHLGFAAVAISTHIHRLNAASQTFARRWDFRHTDWFDEEHQIWAARRVLPEGGADFVDSADSF